VREKGLEREREMRERECEEEVERGLGFLPAVSSVVALE